MHFRDLNIELLMDLKLKGYNVLTSVNKVEDKSPSWIPIKVDNVWDYLFDLDDDPISDRAVLIIDDALAIDFGDLVGQVFIHAN